MRHNHSAALKLLGELDEMHRATPAERVARAQVLATLAQADASQAIAEVLGRIAEALERARPIMSTGPEASASRTVPGLGSVEGGAHSAALPQAGQ
jgi:hypothetical protein